MWSLSSLFINLSTRTATWLFQPYGVTKIMVKHWAPSSESYESVRCGMIILDGHCDYLSPTPVRYYHLQNTKEEYTNARDRKMSRLNDADFRKLPRLLLWRLGYRNRRLTIDHFHMYWKKSVTEAVHHIMLFGVFHWPTRTLFLSLSLSVSVLCTVWSLF